MSEDNLYKSGLPFSEKLAENLQDLYELVKHHNKAAAIIIDGEVGEGKTTLAVHCADYLNKLDGKEPISLEPKEAFQIGMGGLAFIKNLRVVFKSEYPVVIYDEGGDFNRRGALTQFNQVINRIFETYRAFKVVVIICLPSFKVIDQDLLLKGIPKLLLHCENRTKDYGNCRGYGLDRMYWIQNMMKKLPIPYYAYSYEAPNFFSQFLDLPPERRKQLDRLSTNSKLLEAEKAEIKLDGLICQRDLARKLAKTVTWVSIAIKRLKIKPERKISKTWYYKEDYVVEALWNYSMRPEKEHVHKKKVLKEVVADGA